MERCRGIWRARRYLVIHFKGGHATRMPGPAAVWFDPIEHEVSVEDAVPVDANRRSWSIRRLRRKSRAASSRGPLLCRPRMVAARSVGTGRMGTIGAEDSACVAVQEAGDALTDDTLLTVNEIFFGLSDIERMLDQA